MADMFDTLPGDDSEKAIVKAGVAPVVTLSLTGREVLFCGEVAGVVEPGDLLEPESILDIDNEGMEITTPEQRLIANELMGRFKKAEKQIKTWEATNIAPKKAELAELNGDIKPFKNKLTSLIANVNTATKKWDYQIALAARAEQEKEAKRIEAEKQKATQLMIENKRKGEKTPVEVLEVVRQPIPVVGSIKVETSSGKSSGKLGKVWFIIKSDGTEWDKKSRLPFREVEIPGNPDITEDMVFGCVDTVQINEAFKINEGANFPNWIHVREEIINSRFTE